jgi:6-phosphogluconolactonase
MDAWRLTLTFPVLNAAREVNFVVTGADKAPAVQSVRAGSDAMPAAHVDAERTVWLIDQAAADDEAAVSDRATASG